MGRTEKDDFDSFFNNFNDPDATDSGGKTDEPLDIADLDAELGHDEGKKQKAEKQPFINRFRQFFKRKTADKTRHLEKTVISRMYDREIPDTEKNGVLNKILFNIGRNAKKIAEYYRKKGLNYTIATVGYGFGIADTALAVVRILLYFILCDPAYLWTNTIYMVLAIVLPFAGWIFGTEVENLYYHDRKWRFFLLFVIHMVIVLVQPLMYATARICFPLMTTIKISEIFTKGMVVWFGRLISLVLPTLFCLLLVPNLYATIVSTGFRDFIVTFRLNQYIDTRKNKEYLYDLSICRRLDTGEKVVEYEQDRSLHKVFYGQSGTGKTASGELVSIESDLTKKAKNDDCRFKALAEMVTDGKAALKLPEDYDGQFKDEYVMPRKGYEDEYNTICNTYNTAGVVLLAPDDETCNKVVKLCMARGIRPKVIDPSAYDDVNKLWLRDYVVGINPFFVPFDLSIDDEARHVARAALDFKTLLDAVNGGGGGGDKFFDDVNEHITSVVASVCILYYRRCARRQATITDFQKCLQSPKKYLVHIMSDLEDLYGKCTANNLKKDAVFVPMAIKDKDTKEIKYKEKEVDEEYKKYAMKTHAEVGALGLRLSETGWENVFTSVYQELINPQEEGQRAQAMSDKVWEWAYGLRNIISNLTQRPELKKTFEMEKSINFDESMAYGDVVVCNFCLHLGSQLATGLGLMFQQAFNAAALRRPFFNAKQICNVYEYIDELPVILGDWVDQAISLFRKYRVSLTFCIQSSEQFAKNKATEYLKGIVQGVAFQLVFGRAGSIEMETFNYLAGKKKTVTEQTSVNETSLLDDSPSMSYGTRYTEAEEDIMSPYAIRTRDFLEATFFSTSKGRTIDAMVVKMHFLPKNAYDKQERYPVDWKKLSEEFPVTNGDMAYIMELRNQMAVAEEEMRRRNSMDFGTNDMEEIADMAKKEYSASVLTPNGAGVKNTYVPHTVAYEGVPTPAPMPAPVPVENDEPVDVPVENDEPIDTPAENDGNDIDDYDEKELFT